MYFAYEMSTLRNSRVRVSQYSRVFISLERHIFCSFNCARVIRHILEFWEFYVTLHADTVCQDKRASPTEIRRNFPIKFFNNCSIIDNLLVHPPSSLESTRSLRTHNSIQLLECNTSIRRLPDSRVICNVSRRLSPCSTILPTALKDLREVWPRFVRQFRL